MALVFSSGNSVIRSRKREYNMYVYKIEKPEDCDEKEKTVTVTLRMLISYFFKKKKENTSQGIHNLIIVACHTI